MLAHARILFVFAFLIVFGRLSALAQSYNLIIGTYTSSGDSEGIYVYGFNAKTGDFSYKNKVQTADPSYLLLSKNSKYVHAVNELGNGKGTVSSFTFDAVDGSMHFIDSQLAGGDHPCHIAMDNKGRHIIVSNYSGGNFTVFGLESNGTLSEVLQKEQYYGQGANKERQAGPHVHSAFFSSGNDRVYIQDLGTDNIYVYPYNNGNLKHPVDVSARKETPVGAGSGPRHLATDKKGRYVYLITEMMPAVKVYEVRKDSLVLLQEESLLSAGFTGSVGAADVKLSPDGKFLYATNRGDANDITIFSVNKKTGMLTFVDNQPTLGRGPRNFSITPNGKFLLVGNQYTNDIVIFQRDKKTGKLQATGQRIEIGAPVCLVFSN